MKYSYLDEDKARAYVRPTGCIIPGEPRGVQHTPDHVAYCQPGTFERDGTTGNKTRWAKMNYANIHSAYGHSTKL